MDEDPEDPFSDTGYVEERELEDFHDDNGGMANVHDFEPLAPIGDSEQSDQLFWRNFADVINQGYTLHDTNRQSPFATGQAATSDLI